MPDLSGRCVLVLGASTGIGRVIGRRLDGEGARVAFAVRSKGRLDATLEGCSENSAAVAEAGVLQLERTAGVTNSIGTILGGAQASLAEAAAEAFRPGQRAVDMQIHFLSQVKVGAARTEVALVRDDVGHTVVDVELVDAGNDDALLALATVLLRPVSHGSAQRGREGKDHAGC